MRLQYSCACAGRSQRLSEEVIGGGFTNDFCYIRGINRIDIQLQLIYRVIARHRLQTIPINALGIIIDVSMIFVILVTLAFADIGCIFFQISGQEGDIQPYDRVASCEGGAVKGILASGGDGCPEEVIRFAYRFLLRDADTIAGYDF